MAYYIHPLFTVTLALALAFTFGCSSNNDDSGGSASPDAFIGNDNPANLSACVDGTVTIGTQIWQKCNLNVVPTGTDVATNSKCYNDKPSNCAIYGRLYVVWPGKKVY